MSKFSYELERKYYSLKPQTPKAYDELLPYIDGWLDAKKLFKQKRVLEIGAGAGQYSRMIAELFRPIHVVATDLVPTQLLSESETKQCEISPVGADCFNLPFKQDSFDVVWGSLILHRFRALDSITQEIGRVLRPGGTYVGVEPSVRNPIHVYRHVFSLHSRNEFLLGKTQLKKAFSAAGFEIQISNLAPRYPKLGQIGVATCVGICARKKDSRTSNSDS